MLAALKTARMRSQPWSVVWHDSADLHRARHDLALSEQRGVWRLEALLPSADPQAAAWPPGAPAPVLAEADDAATLPGSQPIRPVASCAGSVRSLTLRSGDATVELTVLDAELRTVTLRQPIARVWLDGDDAACGELALSLATAVGLAVPNTSLAAETMATVMNDRAKPRRLGAPALADGLAPAEAFASLIGQLTDVILYWAPRAAARDGTEPVHQMRVALRRLRSCLSIFRHATSGASVDAAAAEARQLAALLGPARDWDVFCTETAPGIVDAFADDAAVAKLLTAAERRRNDAYANLNAFLDGAAFRCFGIRLASLAGGKAWQAELSSEQREMLETDMPGFAGQVLRRRLKRVMEAGDDIRSLDAQALHGLRLDGKKLRYAAEMLSQLFDRKEAQRFLKRLTALQECLGRLNDGVVAASLMAELSGERPGVERAFAAGVVRGFVAAKDGAAREDIIDAWKRFRRLEPFW